MDGLCYLNEIQELGIGYDDLPTFVVYDKSNKKIFPLRESLSTEGLER